MSKTASTLVVCFLLAACQRTAVSAGRLNAAAPVASGQVVFSASAHCESLPGGNFWRCRGPRTPFGPSVVTPTDDPFLTALDATQVLSYRFHCPSVAGLKARLVVNGQPDVDHGFASTRADESRQRTFALNPYRGAYSIEVVDENPYNQTRVAPICALVIDRAYVLPAAEAVAAWTSHLIEQVDELAGIYRDAADTGDDLELILVLNKSQSAHGASLVEYQRAWTAATPDSDARLVACQALKKTWRIAGTLTSSGVPVFAAELPEAERAEILTTCFGGTSFEPGALAGAIRDLRQCVAQPGAADCPLRRGAALAATRASLTTAAERLGALKDWLAGETARLDAIDGALVDRLRVLLQSIDASLTSVPPPR